MGVRTTEQAVFFSRYFAKFSAKVTACLLVSVLLTACEPETPPVAAPVEKSLNQLHRAIYAERLVLDPQFVQSAAEGALVRDLFVGLMAFNPQGEIVPALAKQIQSENSKVWRFVLDENARWSNGEPVLADDLLASWQRLFDRRALSPWRTLLAQMKVKNAQGILTGELPLAVLGVRALNARMLEIELEEANLDFPKWLAHIALLPTYQGGIQQLPITNGDYRLDAVSDKQAVLSAINSATPFQSVVYQTIPIAQHPLWFDLIENPLPSDELNVIKLPRLCSYVYEFNFRDPLMSQKPMRQAIRAMLFSQEISQGLGIPLHFVLPRTVWHEEGRHLSTMTSEHHIEQVETENEKRLKLSLSFEPTGLNEQVANRLMRMLAQSDHFSLTTKPIGLDFQLAQADYCAPYAEPSLFLSRFHSKSTENRSGYENPKVDEWLEQLTERNMSQQERAEIIRRIVRELEQDIALLPLFQYQRRIARDPSISGISPDNSSEVIYSKDLSRQQKDK